MMLMNKIATSRTLFGTILVLALVLPETAQGATRFTGRRVSSLPADAVNLSREVLARVQLRLLDKDMRRLLALTVLGRTPPPPILQRNALLDSTPLLQNTLVINQSPLSAGVPISHVSFTETMAGTAVYSQTGQILTATSLTGQRTGFGAGAITGSLTGVATPPATALGNLIVPGFSVTASGSGVVFGNTLVNGTGQMILGPIPHPGSLGPVTFSNFTIKPDGASSATATGGPLLWPPDSYSGNVAVTYNAQSH
jgi:hypothetical protein